jgi:hypothetical protein
VKVGVEVLVAVSVTRGVEVDVKVGVMVGVRRLNEGPNHSPGPHDVIEMIIKTQSISISNRLIIYPDLSCFDIAKSLLNCVLGRYLAE